MFVVLKQNTYAGDGCEQTSGYTVEAVYGPFLTSADADAWVAKQSNSYAIEYDVQEMETAS